MPRRNHRVKSRRARRNSARVRDEAIRTLQVRTAKATRKALMRERQKAAWAKLPDWIGRRQA